MSLNNDQLDIPRAERTGISASAHVDQTLGCFGLVNIDQLRQYQLHEIGHPVDVGSILESIQWHVKSYRFYDLKRRGLRGQLAALAKTKGSLR